LTTESLTWLAFRGILASRALYVTLNRKVSLYHSVFVKYLRSLEVLPFTFWNLRQTEREMGSQEDERSLLEVGLLQVLFLSLSL